MTYPSWCVVLPWCLLCRLGAGGAGVGAGGAACAGVPAGGAAVALAVLVRR